MIFIIFVTNKVLKMFLTKKYPTIYPSFNNTHIASVNRTFRIAKFTFFNLRIIRSCYNFFFFFFWVMYIFYIFLVFVCLIETYFCTNYFHTLLFISYKTLYLNLRSFFLYINIIYNYQNILLLCCIIFWKITTLRVLLLISLCFFLNYSF